MFGLGTFGGVPRDDLRERETPTTYFVHRGTFTDRSALVGCATLGSFNLCLRCPWQFVLIINMLELHENRLDFLDVQNTRGWEVEDQSFSA